MELVVRRPASQQARRPLGPANLAMRGRTKTSSWRIRSRLPFGCFLLAAI